MLSRLIYRLWKDKFNTYIYNEQKLSYKDIEYDYSFTTSDGKMHYTYKQMKDAHLTRDQKISEYMLMLSKQINSDESAEMDDVMLDALNNTDKHGNMRPRLDVLGVILNERIERRDKIVNYNIIYGLIACLNLNQTEIDNGGVFDEQIHKSKIEQFKKDNESEPLHGFFLRSGISTYLPFIKTLTKEYNRSTEIILNNILKESQAYIESYSQQLQAIKGGLSATNTK